MRKVSRHSYNCRINFVRQSRDSLRLSGEKLKLGDMNVTRHAHECLATVVRMKMKLQLHSLEFVRLSRMSRDCHTTVAQLSCDIREIYFQK